jgi:type I restriction enzyme S subunit
VLSLVQYGTSQKANTQGSGVPVLRIKNVKNGRIDLSELRHVELSPSAVASLLLQPGDILIIRTSGSRDLVGTCAVFHEAGRYVCASYLIRMRVDRTVANPDYVAWFVNSGIGRLQVDAISRQIMQNNINSAEVRALRIALPPIDVQDRIVGVLADGRARISRELDADSELTRRVESDVESYILGTKAVKTP